MYKEKHVENMKKRGYRQEIIDRSIRGIKFPDRQKTLTNKTHDAGECLTFSIFNTFYWLHFDIRGGVVVLLIVSVLLIYGLVSRALQVRQLLLHFLIGGSAFGAGKGSQRRLSSRSIFCVIVGSSNLARVSCFLMLL